MRFNFPDGNMIEFTGNKWFVSNVLAVLAPAILTPYWSVGSLNTEPFDNDWFKVEVQMAREATEKGQAFNGKYISYVPPDSNEIVLGRECSNESATGEL